jgi:sugar phosphate isomerase/epimerase
MIQGLILHSVSYSGSWGQHALSVEEFLDKAAEFGYDGVMLMAKRPHLSVLDWHTEARRWLRERLESRGLRTVCIAGYTNFTADLEHGDIPHREIQIRHVSDLAEMAHDLGGTLVPGVHRIREPVGDAARAVEDDRRSASRVLSPRDAVRGDDRSPKPSRSRLWIRKPERSHPGR